MNTAQKRQFVLNAAKSYPIKGGSTQRLYGELRKDAQKIMNIAKKFKAGRGNMSDTRNALQIVRKYQTHPLYRVLGVERDAKNYIARAVYDIGTSYLFQKQDEMPVEKIIKYTVVNLNSSANKLLSLSRDVQRIYHQRQRNVRF